MTDEPAVGQGGQPSAADAAPPQPGRWRTAHRVAAITVVSVLLGVLGFAIVVQLHSNSSADSLSGLREDDLIRILDDQNARSDRLQQQIAELRGNLAKLQASGGRDAAARDQAEHEAQALGVLLGTLPATGPGIQLTITDPQQKLRAEDLLDVVEELRGAGAEAVQFGPVRVGVSTSFTDLNGAVTADGSSLQPPYVVLAIGDPDTLRTALDIPGGVAATVRAAGGQATISEAQALTITAVRQLPTPRYAKPSGR
jgi:uncharacterized protein YlxW (UPF0749 family)